MKTIEFKTPQEFVKWLMDNEGRELLDAYGRKWKYEMFKFLFKDIGTEEEYNEGLKCLHLYGTTIFVKELALDQAFGNPLEQLDNLI